MIYLTFLSIVFSLAVASPCPCELVVDETPTIPKTYRSIQPSQAEETTGDFPEATANDQATDKYEDLTNLYPFIRQTESLATLRRRFKRPSWAKIGKRSSMQINKRPAWATIG